jgi:hypothetical protein
MLLLHERVIERSIRTLYEHLRTILADRSHVLPPKLYGEALQYCTDSINAMPNSKTVNRSPTEIVTGIKPVARDYSFGQIGLFFHTSKRHSDLDSNDDYGILVGFNRDARNRYRVYILLSDILVSRGAFQALDKPLPEWGLTPRLRPRSYTVADGGGERGMQPPITAPQLPRIALTPRVDEALLHQRRQAVEGTFRPDPVRPALAPPHIINDALKPVQEAANITAPQLSSPIPPVPLDLPPPKPPPVEKLSDNPVINKLPQVSPSSSPYSI